MGLHCDKVDFRALEIQELGRRGPPDDIKVFEGKLSHSTNAGCISESSHFILILCISI